MTTPVKDSASLSAPSDANEITRSNQLNSPLLRLPGEIRNRIYECVFFNAKVMVTDPDWDWNGRVPWWNGRAPWRNERPNHVLATCQQIRHEATTIFWNTCIIDAQFAMCLVDLEPVVGSSNCARITSLVMGINAAEKLIEAYSCLPDPNIQEKFPMLRKLYVLYNWPKVSRRLQARLPHCLSTLGIKVEYKNPKWNDSAAW